MKNEKRQRVDNRPYGHTDTVVRRALYPEGHPYRNVHGHSFRLEATVAGKVKPGEEWVQDFSELAAVLSETAIKLDHCLLNEIEGLEVPTLERIAVWAANDLKPKLPGLKTIVLARPSLDERCVLVVS